ncbi:MAG: sporulation protein YqfD [bacterium]|nr:sporulation protein YqfD [bacterium]MCM1376662.1 sporulation protein YqfD [Muribaculum sp.]
MVAVLQFLKGYIRMKVWGVSPERFLNLCSNKDILLWDISRDGDVYTMCISLKAFLKLRPIARKTGVRVAILQRYGLPFLLPSLLRRKIFIVGLVLCVTFWLVSYRFIWDIRLEGNYRITQEVFSDFLTAQQIHVGMQKTDLDINILEKEIRRAFPEVTWTSARLSGTRLEISIKENDAPIITQEETYSGGQDLISEHGGIITSMIVRSGVPVVKIGDVVEEGTLLVEGRVPIYNEDATIREYLYTTADADITVEHTILYQETLPDSYIEKVYTGRVDRRPFLRVSSKELRLPQERPYLVYDTVIQGHTPVFLEKLSIPISWGQYIHREYMNVEHEYTLEQAQKLLTEKEVQFISNLEEKGVHIIEKDVKIEESSVCWIMECQILADEPTGRLAPTTVGEP